MTETIETPKTTTLADLSRDVQAIEHGDWESPGPEFGTLQLKVRGFGDTYQDRLAARQESEVRVARREGVLKPRQGWEDLPLSLRQRINDEVMLDAVFIDCRGIDASPGVPLSAEEYRRLAKQPKFGRLTQAVRLCAEIISTRKAADLEDAVGNSRRGFATTSNGESTPTS